VKSLEVEDASPTAAALHRWVERLAEREVERLTRRCKHYEEPQGVVPRWVQRGMGARWERV
jgi:hypothetical protein